MYDDDDDAGAAGTGENQTGDEDTFPVTGEERRLLQQCRTHRLPPSEVMAKLSAGSATKTGETGGDSDKPDPTRIPNRAEVDQQIAERLKAERETAARLHREAQARDDLLGVVRKEIDADPVFKGAPPARREAIEAAAVRRLRDDPKVVAMNPAELTKALGEAAKAAIADERDFAKSVVGPEVRDDMGTRLRAEAQAGETGAGSARSAGQGSTETPGADFLEELEPGAVDQNFGTEAEILRAQDMAAKALGRKRF